MSISERASAGSDVAVLADRSWGTRSHRETLAELVLLGWTPCGVGDWAVALRSPGGRLAARICPFDPAYSAFLELCRRCAGNRYLPHIDLNQGNVRQSVDGRLTLVDVFCMDGAALYGQILQDPAVVRRLIPADHRRHLLEIPYLARESSPAELRALQDAWLGMEPEGSVRRLRH